MLVHFYFIFQSKKQTCCLLNSNAPTKMTNYELSKGRVLANEFDTLPYQIYNIWLWKYEHLENWSYFGCSFWLFNISRVVKMTIFLTDQSFTPGNISYGTSRFTFLGSNFRYTCQIYVDMWVLGLISNPSLCKIRSDGLWQFVYIVP